jgi:protein-serine/threonine kinase
MLISSFRLITSPDRRLNIEQIKKHAFFYGVEWDAIRRIDAPFVPHLRSITDTSYFPTDDIEQGPAESPVADPNGAQKDLAFLGYEVYSPLSSAGYSYFRHRYTFKRFTVSSQAF